MAALSLGHLRGTTLAHALRHQAWILLAVTVFLTVFAAVSSAAAQDAGATGGSEAIFIAELGLLLLVGRLMGEAAHGSASRR